MTKAPRFAPLLDRAPLAVVPSQPAVHRIISPSHIPLCRLIRSRVSAHLLCNARYRFDNDAFVLRGDTVVWCADQPIGCARV